MDSCSGTDTPLTFAQRIAPRANISDDAKRAVIPRFRSVNAAIPSNPAAMLKPTGSKICRSSIGRPCRDHGHIGRSAPADWTAIPWRTLNNRWSVSSLFEIALSEIISKAFQLEGIQSFSIDFSFIGVTNGEPVCSIGVKSEMSANMVCRANTSHFIAIQLTSPRKQRP